MDQNGVEERIELMKSDFPRLRMGKEREKEEEKKKLGASEVICCWQ